MLAVWLVPLELGIAGALRNAAGLVQIVSRLWVVGVATQHLVDVGQTLGLTFPLGPRSFRAVLPQVVQAFRLLHFFGFCVILKKQKNCPLVSVIWLVSQPHYSTG